MCVVGGIKFCNDISIVNVVIEKEKEKINNNKNNIVGVICRCLSCSELMFLIEIFFNDMRISKIMFFVNLEFMVIDWVKGCV